MMNPRVKQQMKKAKKIGMSPLELAQMKETARKAAERQIQEMREETLERAFLFMVAIPLNVLSAFYWEKTAKKKAPKFLDEIFFLYNEVINDRVTDEELGKFIEETTGLDLADNWQKFKEKMEK